MSTATAPPTPLDRSLEERIEHGALIEYLDLLSQKPSPEALRLLVKEGYVGMSVSSVFEKGPSVPSNVKPYSIELHLGTVEPNPQKNEINVTYVRIEKYSPNPSTQRKSKVDVLIMCKLPEVMSFVYKLILTPNYKPVIP